MAPGVRASASDWSVDVLADSEETDQPVGRQKGADRGALYRMRGV